MDANSAVRRVTLGVFAALLATGVAAPLPAQEPTKADLLVILDASGSMWGEIGGENKIVTARRVFRDLLDRLADGSEVGLVAYGHRRERDCTDIETIVPMAPLDPEGLAGRVDAIDPKGRTPITGAVTEAMKTVAGRSAPTTVVLVSDGLETCGGDPCAAVRLARDAGLPFAFNVIGFGVEGEDVSSLECMAQAGGGFYFPAGNAQELAAALDQAAATPPEVPPGRLSVEVVADGALADAGVRVFRAGTREELGYGRTYTSSETNPRVVALPAGTYDVEITMIGLRGNPTQRLTGLVVNEGDPVERTVDFSTGELAIGVTRNGELSDAVIRVLIRGTTQQVAGGRTYRAANTNPLVLRLTPGEYDVEIGSVELAGRPSHTVAARVQPQQRAAHDHAFASGTVRVGVVQGNDLVDATVRVLRPGTREQIGSSRTYTSAASNPTTFEVEPGQYLVEVRAVRLEGRPSQELEIIVEAGATIEQVVRF